MSIASTAPVGAYRQIVVHPAIEHFSLVKIPEEEVVDGIVHEGAAVARDVAHTASNIVRRIVGESPETIALVERLHSQVFNLSNSVATLNKALVEVTELNIKLVALLNLKQ